MTKSIMLVLMLFKAVLLIVLSIVCIAKEKSCLLLPGYCVMPGLGVHPGPNAQLVAQPSAGEFATIHTKSAKFGQNQLFTCNYMSEDASHFKTSNISSYLKTIINP